MQPDASKIRQLLKKTSHFDKDERFMATSDLTGELEKVDGLLDSSLQVPIRDAILKQLDDASNDVQSVACKCLSQIVQKFNCEQVEEIVDKLGSVLINCKMDVRDIYTIALKNIITAVPDDYGPQISKKLLKRIIQGLKMKVQRGDTEEENQEHSRNHFNRLVACLDILKDLVVRFGFVMVDSHEEILNTIQPMLNDSKTDIRKKVAVSLGAIVGVVNDKLFKSLMNGIIDQIKRTKRDDEKIFTYIQTIGVFSKNGGKRISSFLEHVVPLLIDICSDSSLEDSSEAAIELRENCLQAFETLVVQCPKEISRFTEELLKVALRLMTFDPLYNYDEDEEMKNNNNDDDNKDDDGFGDDDDDWDDDDGDGGWDDDNDTNTNNQGLNTTWDQGGDIDGGGSDDTSWKVRRAAVKMLAAFIQTHKSSVEKNQSLLMDKLLVQFREHDSTVKLEVFTTFRELLLATIVGDQGITTQQLTSLTIPSLARQKTEYSGILEEKLKSIMEQIVKQMSLNVNNSEIRSGLLGIIRDLVVVRQAERSTRCVELGPQGLQPYFDTLIPQVISCCKDKEIQLKTKGLHILYLILKRHDPKYSVSIISSVKDIVISSVEEDYSRVKAQALMTAGRIMECIRPMKNGDLNYNKDFEQIAKDIFSVSFKQLALKDVEQEVKKAALDCIAVCVAHFGDVVGKMTLETLKILTQRLSNEVTRQTALHSFTTISNSPLNIDLSKVCNECVKDMSSFLRKHSQSLKMDSAIALAAVYKSSGNKIDLKLTTALVEQCKEFINDSDLHLCHLILELLSQILLVQNKSSKSISTIIFPECFKFLKSPLLQGHALEALKRLFETFQKTTQGKVVKFEQLKNDLIKSAVPKLSRQSYSAISQCLSTLCLQINDKEQFQAVTELISLIDSKNDNHSQVALLCIGEMGKKKDLSEHKNIESKIFRGFYRESEAVKWAASYALGNIAVGNMKKYVPVLLKMIQEKNEKQYLLLNSLKEIITVHSYNNLDFTNLNSKVNISSIGDYTNSIVPLLLRNANSQDEGVRAMVAECLGKFAIIDESIFDQITKLLSDSQFTTRATMAAALKFGVTRKSAIIIKNSNTISKFLNLLNDKDLTVKRQAFLTINTMLHVSPSLISDELSSVILPVIYKATFTNQKLIREVDLGPFKHKIDDGLPLRKAAFQCLDTLLESVPSKLDLNDFLKHLTNGIQDDSHDIQMLTYQIFYRLGQFHGASIVSGLDDLPGPLMKGFKAKMNEAKGNKDAERAKDILRAAVKALYTLRQIPSVMKAKKFVNFYSRVGKTKMLVPMINELKKDSKNRR